MTEHQIQLVVIPLCNPLPPEPIKIPIPPKPSNPTFANLNQHQSQIVNVMQENICNMADYMQIVLDTKEEHIKALKLALLDLNEINLNLRNQLSKLSGIDPEVEAAFALDNLSFS